MVEGPSDYPQADLLAAEVAGLGVGVDVHVLAVGSAALAVRVGEDAGLCCTRLRMRREA